MVDCLQEIVKKVYERLKAHKMKLSRAQLHKEAKLRKPAKHFAEALRRKSAMTIIAEFKQASPSAGLIRLETDLAGRLRGYERGGAAALSILTEEDYFKGTPYSLELARRFSSLPLLRKDFIVDPYQIEESRAMGADAILLIATLLSVSQLKEFQAQASELGMDALVEIHTISDLDKALAAGASLIGVNHRDLRTLTVDLTVSQRLLPLLPKNGETVVVESGIKCPEDLRRFRGQGVHAALIGEALMRDSNPEKRVVSFVRAGRLKG